MPWSVLIVMLGDDESLSKKVVWYGASEEVFVKTKASPFRIYTPSSEVRHWTPSRPVTL